MRGHEAVLGVAEVSRHTCSSSRCSDLEPQTSAMSPARSQKRPGQSVESSRLTVPSTDGAKVPAFPPLAPDSKRWWPTVRELPLSPPDSPLLQWGKLCEKAGSDLAGDDYLGA